MITITSRLIAFAGLPGVGKTTLAKEAARNIGAVYLRVDSIEMPFQNICSPKAEGYVALVNIARENIELGNTVVVDAVNPVHESRRLFTELAVQTGVELLQFECVLSNKDEHKRRVEGRTGSSQHNPTWQEVVQRQYEVWDVSMDGDRKLIDTSDKESALQEIMKTVRSNI